MVTDVPAATRPAAHGQRDRQGERGASGLHPAAECGWHARRIGTRRPGEVPMLHATRLVVLITALALATTIGAKEKRRSAPCPDVAAAVAAACPCAGAWKNHGQYVRCVVHTRHAMRKAGCSRDALSGVVVAAARSTC